MMVRMIGKWAKRKNGYVSRTEAGFGHGLGEVLRSGFVYKYIGTEK